MKRAPLYRPRAGSIPTLGVPSLDAVRTVHLIGVGGAGMRNLARLFLSRGIAVSGSDLKDSEGLRELAAAGARVRVGHDAEALDHPDAVVISTAIAESNPELAAARDRGLAVWARQQAIAAFAAGHRSIAVAGTTGKTTTTSMIATVLEHAGLDPTYLIGGDLNESGSGARAGESDLFLFEADESDGSFLLTDPTVGVVTNVEVDHVDFYPGGEEELRLAFAEFCARSDRLVVCADDEGARGALRIAGVDAIRYGVSAEADPRLTIETPGPGGARGTVVVDGSPVSLALQVDGAHNLLDAAAAIAVARILGVPAADAAHALSTFGGIKRRFEHRGSARGAEFFDDYAHVPTELAVTLGVARARKPRRLVALFQPHRYSRTQALWRELGESLTEADVIVVTDVYAANQTPIPGVTGALVVDGVRRAAPEREVVYAPHGEDAISFLAGEVREGDLVITLGCGDVWMLGDATLARIGETDDDA
ncbi:MAG TPA: UDP-N-acetylmuramate--L-alanine ligase [Actinomycetota bacterium]|nr:UDP-N-acetylmuramate--L-alanine ligase [Actinomycetota bacterium]